MNNWKYTLVDKGACYYDPNTKPTEIFDDKGNLISWIYCPYIPKFLFVDKKPKSKINIF